MFGSKQRKAEKKQRDLLNEEIEKSLRQIGEYKLTETKMEKIAYVQQLMEARDRQKEAKRNKYSDAVKAAAITGFCGCVATLGGIALIQHGETVGAPMIGKGSIMLPKPKI